MLGELCALAAAFTWALSVILFKRSEQVSPGAMNLFKNVVALLLLLVTMPLMGVGFASGRSFADWGLLAISGVLGIAFADTLMLTALRHLGASLFAVVECCYAPVIVALGVLVLGEAVSAALLVGGGLVVLGVLYALTEKPVTPTSAGEDSAALREAAAQVKRRRGYAMLMGATGIVSMGIGVVIAKPVLEASHLVEVTTVRLAAGVIAQLIWVMLWPGQRKNLRVFLPSATWRTLLPGSVLGTYVAMLLWLGGFKWAPASSAAVLNQTSSVFTMGLAWLLLGDALSARRALGAAMALGGAMLVIIL